MFIAFLMEGQNFIEFILLQVYVDLETLLVKE